MTEKEFKQNLSELGINITEKQLEQLHQYYLLTEEYNQVMNLTTINDEKDFYLKHFYDSATIVKIIDLKTVSTLCDIGSGAGFPGIVLKILFPNLKITLIDSLNKRIEFLKIVISKLGLDKIEAIHERAEIYARQHINCFDLTVARAVAKTSTLLEYAMPMTKLDGHFVAMKGRMENEASYTNACNKLMCIENKKIEFELPENGGQRTLILFNKQKPTPPQYPRANKFIKNNPL